MVFDSLLFWVSSKHPRAFVSVLRMVLARNETFFHNNFLKHDLVVAIIYKHGLVDFS